MKILNIIALLGLTTLPIDGCSKKESETQQVQYKTYNLKFSEINNCYLQSFYKKGSDPVHICNIPQTYDKHKWFFKKGMINYKIVQEFLKNNL